MRKRYLPFFTRLNLTISHGLSNGLVPRTIPSHRFYFPKFFFFFFQLIFVRNSFLSLVVLPDFKLAENSRLIICGGVMKLKYQTWRGQSAYWQWSPVPYDLPLSFLTSHVALLAPPWLFLSVSMMGASIPFCVLCHHF